MSQTAPSTITALPTPPSTSNVTSFDVRADAFLGQFPTLVTEVNNVASVTYNNAVDAYNNATTASAAAVTAQAAAATAQAYAGATAWVSGTTYAIGDVRWSPGNGRIYRRITNGAGTTDPYNDPTNWSLVPTSTPITHITSALVTQASSGMFYAFERTTTQGSATNLLLYSSAFDNGTWTKTNTSVVANTTMSPTGDTSADKLVENSSTAFHQMGQNVSVASNVAYSLSFVCKSAGRSTVSLQIDDSGGSNYVRSNYDLASGVASGTSNNGTGSGASATITHLGNGWYLCTLSGTPSTANSGTTRVIVGIPSFASTVGDGTSGVYLWGAQLETGTTATSYIFTGSLTATRSSGVVYPQRLILPSSPVNDMIVRVMVSNGVDTNIVDPNGATIMGVNGPIQLDNPYASVTFQYSSSTWRMINA